MTTTTTPKVLGTGLLALDLVISAQPDRPIQSFAGGTCGNVLSILAYLGWDAYPIARLNHDTAATRLAIDLARWGVHLDYVHAGKTTSTPIIIQENRLTAAGVPKHKFTWACPKCGHWLPGFRPITRDVIDDVMPATENAAVFFLDRLSRAALTLAGSAAENGALVVFEPSGRSDPKLFDDAIKISHIVKYADQRLSDAGGTMSEDTATLLEVQTLGSKGLRFRHKKDTVPTEWIDLDAVPTTDIVDTCGSGDWCTAGLLAKLATNGRHAFTTHDLSTVIDALNYGQTLAAWNCAFEGARGGMYVDIHDDLSTLDGYRTEQVTHGVAISCPACPE
ncbi:PfkB family carbohydrate kinase [Rathayibacter sp. VKM Ac-2760]|uniref:PfkB family carbohydrate kinase n=1 Tax=Rathayibacter sp. VKM Ac-2760 TaxID=2609253 RepID=UPI001316C727|nr:PfkB family carbohydrate kinase [Rathayibacter sp. VKM Ac-2760]QHC61136.1 carbohydrate kinase [Rathayibacter sp. VKM Ac-2760]